jgi:uncharacterized protein (DUF1810 family)
MNDQFNLQRFVDAQQPVFETAHAELQAGRKRTHWMWFIFPQLAGLGSSATAEFYAIRGRAEAAAYLQHPVLGARLVECAAALLAVEGRSASQILGFPDDLKLRSCATLFASVAPPGSLFEQLIDKYFDGEPDARTIHLLQE